jgi:hypothetical protein
MKKLLLVCAFFIGVSTVSFAQGRQQRSPDEQVATLKTQVTGLTDDQATKIKAIYVAQAASRDSLMKAANGDFASMRPAFFKMTETTNNKVKAVLTADQAAAYQKAVIDPWNERMKQMQ